MHDSKKTFKQYYYGTTIVFARIIYVLDGEIFNPQMGREMENKLISDIKKTGEKPLRARWNVDDDKGYAVCSSGISVPDEMMGREEEYAKKLEKQDYVLTKNENELPNRKNYKRFASSRIADRDGYETSMKMDATSKKGVKFEKGEKVVVKWKEGNYILSYIYKEKSEERMVVLTNNLHKYVNGASKEPSFSKLERMSEDGVATSVLGKRVEPDGTDPHGSPSWILVKGLI